MNNIFTDTLIEDSFQAYLVEEAQFTSNEEYPVLKPTMISRTIPSKIMPFSKAITSHEDLRNTYICTYSPDKTFERIRRNPQKYLAFFQRTAGIIGFDFSIHTDMPLIKQKSQINDNLSLTYYYGYNGIPIIPNLRCGIDELLPEFLSAIPKHSLVAVGTHGFIKERKERFEWYVFLESIIENLNPSGILVYGTLPGKLFLPLRNKVPFFFYEPWICSDRKERSNVN